MAYLRHHARFCRTHSSGRFRRRGSLGKYSSAGAGARKYSPSGRRNARRNCAVSKSHRSNPKRSAFSDRRSIGAQSLEEPTVSFDNRLAALRNRTSRAAGRERRSPHRHHIVQSRDWDLCDLVNCPNWNCKVKSTTEPQAHGFRRFIELRVSPARPGGWLHGS